MAAQSLFRKGLQQLTPVTSGTGDANANLQTVMFLNKDYFTTEWFINITASRTGSVAATGANIVNAISSVLFETNGSAKGGNGVRLSLSGKEFYELGRFTEGQPAPIVTFGATLNTAVWTIDLHAEMDEALNDYISGIFTADYSQIKLTINWNTDATASVFSGGTLTGNTTFAVTVLANEMPVLPKDGQGNLIGNAGLYGTQYQVIQSVTKTPSAAGQGDDVLLQCGNLTRFIQVTAFDHTGALSDSVVGQVQMLFGGLNYQATWAQLKQQNAANRGGYSATGVAFIDFGDDPAGWLDTRQLNEARLKWTNLDNSGATVKFAQCLMKPLGS